MSYKTITFQKSECGGRPAGFLTKDYDGEKYIATHFCLVISADLYKSLRYNITTEMVDCEEVERI